MIKLILYKIFKIDDVCDSCEILKQQLELVNAEKRLLLDNLLELTRDEKIMVEQKPPENIEPIKPRVMPWRIQREMLEANDRKRAQALKARQIEIDNNKKIAELEKELLDEVSVDNDINNSSNTGT